jgi:hypothetical protein
VRKEARCAHRVWESNVVTCLSSTTNRGCGILPCLESECQAKSNRYRSNRPGIVQAATGIDTATICTVVAAGGAAALWHGKNAKEKFAIAKATKEENENENESDISRNAAAPLRPQKAGRCTTAALNLLIAWCHRVTRKTCARASFIGFRRLNQRRRKIGVLPLLFRINGGFAQKYYEWHHYVSSWPCGPDWQVVSTQKGVRGRGNPYSLINVNPWTPKLWGVPSKGSLDAAA